MSTKNDLFKIIVVFLNVYFNVLLECFSNYEFEDYFR
jgi:hypothetical protein